MGAAVGAEVSPAEVLAVSEGVVFGGVSPVLAVSATGGSMTPNQSAVHFLCFHFGSSVRNGAGIESCGVQSSVRTTPTASVLQFAVQVHSLKQRNQDQSLSRIVAPLTYGLP